MIVAIVQNPLDPSSWEKCETDDPLAVIRSHYRTWPSAARVYDLAGIELSDRVAAMLGNDSLSARDVTPTDEAGIERFARAEGPLLVTIPPADPGTIALIVAGATLLLSVVAFVLMPKVPTQTNTPSNNRSLSNRTNQARPGARIPDIFGTIRSVPDMIQQPYRRFDANLEYEIGYMCVGRGSYDIEDVRDGNTLISSIAGATAAFYGPNTSPNTGDAPQITIGSAINYLAETIIPVDNVNGQTLLPPNSNSVSGDNSIRFIYPDLIETNDSSIDFTTFFDTSDNLVVSGADFGNSGTAGTTSIQTSSRFTYPNVIEFETFDPSTVFAAGQMLTISGAGWAEQDGLGSTIYVDLGGAYPIASVDGPGKTVTLSDPGDINTDWTKLNQLSDNQTGYRSNQFAVATATSSLDLDGTYPVLAVTSNQITLSNPEAINGAWANVAGLDGGETDYGSPSLATTGERWIGPFIVDLENLTHVISNFIGPAGLYEIKSSSGKQHAVSVEVGLELTPVDINDNPTGPAEFFSFWLTGDSVSRDQVGATLDAHTTFTGRASMRARRISSTDLDYKGTLVDTVKWRDVYGGAPVGNIAFGNVTTVMTKTYATSGATSVKERKFNLRARRRVPQWNPETASFGNLIGSDDMADIICAMTLDPFIGGLTMDDIDVPQIYATSAEIAAYFGTPNAAEFAFTFDDDSTSYQDAVQSVAQACFCQAYRQGRLLRLAFVRATEDSTLLFNGRNLVPGDGGNKRSARFGIADNQNGAQVTWTDPTDGAQLTITVPTYTTPTSPKKVDIPGLGNAEIAYFQLWRAWNRMLFQNTTAQSEVTQEAGVLLPQDRILIADPTRQDLLSSNVEAQNGTVLTLADPMDLDPDTDYQIFVQLVDATVQSIPVSAWVPPAGQDPDPTKVQLAALPRTGLVIGSEYFSPSTTTIVAVDDVQTRAFLVDSREQASDLTETVTAINYTFLYYQNDQLALWLPIFAQAVYDESASANAVVQTGGAIVNDATRDKYVYQGTGAGSMVTTTVEASPDSYTKSAWVKGASGSILKSDVEDFGIVAGQLVAKHGATSIGAQLDAAAWHFVAVSFDSTANVATLFIDGLAVQSGALPDRALDGITAFSGFSGYADDVRLYTRNLSATEVMEIWLGSINPIPNPGLLLTNTDDRVITDNSGHGFILG